MAWRGSGSGEKAAAKKGFSHEGPRAGKRGRGLEDQVNLLIATKELLGMDGRLGAGPRQRAGDDEELGQVDLLIATAEPLGKGGHLEAGARQRAGGGGDQGSPSAGEGDSPMEGEGSVARQRLPKTGGAEDE